MPLPAVSPEPRRFPAAGSYSGSVALLDTDRMALQLTQLERRPARDGKDSITIPAAGTTTY